MKKISAFSLAVIFCGISIFLQVAPISTASHYTNLFHISTTELAKYTSLFFLTYALLQIPVGLLLDRFGVRLLLPIGLFITLISTIFHWFASDPTVLGFARLFTGIGCSVAYVSAVFIASNLFKRQYIALCIALVEIVSTVGAILAGNFLTNSDQFYGWNAVNLISISFIFIIFILVVKFIFFEKELFKKSYESHNISFLKNIIDCLSLLKNKLVVSILIYCFLTWLIIMTFAGFWIKSYFIKTHGFSVNQSLWLSQIYWFSFLFVSLFIGNYAKNIKSCSRTLVVLSIMNTVSLLYFIMPWLSTYPVLCMIFILSGAATSGVVVALSMLVFLVPKEIKGSAIALANTFIVLGAYLGQVLFGYFSSDKRIIDLSLVLHPQMLTDYSAIFLFPIAAGVSFLIAIYLYFKIKKHVIIE